MSENLCVLENVDCFSVLNEELVSEIDLFIVDPPYGGIINEGYDRISHNGLVNLLVDLCEAMAQCASKGATAYIFGGIGTYRSRSFLQFMIDVEHFTGWKIHNLITWKKRRGYGTQYNYLFTREEILMLVLGDRPKIFNVPYTEEERSEEWKKRLMNQDHKPMNNNLRRSNVFCDVTEIMRDKLCSAEKPEKLYEILIETSSDDDSLVCDPMCGSGTAGVVCNKMGKRSLLLEKDRVMYGIARDRIQGCMY